MSIRVRSHLRRTATTSPPDNDDHRRRLQPHEVQHVPARVLLVALDGVDHWRRLSAGTLVE